MNRRACSTVDAVAAHVSRSTGLWQIHEWPQKLDELKSVTELPVWVSEVGVSTSAPRKCSFGD